MNGRRNVALLIGLLILADVWVPVAGGALTISGAGQDVRLTVTGRIDSASNNCDCWVGIGPTPGTGVLIQFGFYGGGCATQGYNVNARGVLLDAQELRCVFSGNWLWINSGQSYTATLTLEGWGAQLSVPGIGTSSGNSVWEGEASVLYVGRQGDNDFPSCSGAIDHVIIEVKRAGGDWTIVDQEDFSTDQGFTSTDPELFISGGRAVWTVHRNEGAQFLYRDLLETVVSDDICPWGEVKALFK